MDYEILCIYNHIAWNSTYSSEHLSSAGVWLHRFLLSEASSPPRCPTGNSVIKPMLEAVTNYTSDQIELRRL
jgi:hypothetical protein